MVEFTYSGHRAGDTGNCSSFGTCSYTFCKSKIMKNNYNSAVLYKKIAKTEFNYVPIFQNTNNIIEMLLIPRQRNKVVITSEISTNQ